MKALIIAAGPGKRLIGYRSKPLTKLLGLTLIERAIIPVTQTGITDFVIVVGYRGKEIIEYLSRVKRKGIFARIKYVWNNDWQKENGLSVFKAKEAIGDEDFLLLMADHVFEPQILKNFLLDPISIRPKTTLLVDQIHGIFDLADATKLYVRKNKAFEIGKDLPTFNAIDCGIFYCKKDLFSALEESINDSRYRLSDAVQRLIYKDKLDVVDVDGRFWCDIDTPESLKYAEKKLLQSLVKPTDGPIAKVFNRKLSTRISKMLVKTNVAPNELSVGIFLLSIFAALLFFYNNLVIGGLLCQLSAILDGCDGEVARLKFMKSKYGTFMDSVLDRYADAFLILGLCWSQYMISKNILFWIVGIFAIVGSLLFSYTNARYEAVFEKDIVTRIPIRRDTRLFLIMLGALTRLVLPMLFVLAFFTNLEVIRRICIKHIERR